MKAFDFNRFLNVARWDININRKFYIRQVIVIVGCVLLPIIYSYLKSICGFLLMSDGMTFSQYRSMTAISFHDVHGYAYYFCIIYPMVIIQMLCYMFHNLTTKQGRINELTLPASNQERFLWHVVSKVGGTILVFVAGMVLADIMHVVLGFVLFGITNPQSLLQETWKLIAEDTILVNFNGTAYARFSIMCSFTFLSLCFFSTFSLGSALKYKHTFGYVLLFHIVFWIVVIFLFSLAAYILTHIDFCKLTIVCHVPEWLQSVILNIPPMALLCSMWWITYRLYCRAQITTRRNP